MPEVDLLRPPGPLATPPGAGRRPSFDEVYEEHLDMVWRTARRLGVHPDALDDVIQEVFLVVHRRLGDFEARSTVRTWVYSIVLRTVQDHRRSHRRKDEPLVNRETDPDSLQHRDGGPAEATEQAQARRLLQHLLDTLDDERREVLVLTELEEMTAPEIAEALGTPLNTVYTRLRLARRDFEQALARHQARSTPRTP